MFAWFRRPRAGLEMEVAPSPPPSSGAVTVRVSLTPREPFQIRRGCIELIYTETYFAPTALDGYHEHTSSRVYAAEAIAEGVTAQPGISQEYRVVFQLPAEPPPRGESRPVRLAWQVRATFHLRRFRTMRRTYRLADIPPGENGAPEVDGRSVLPYERALPRPGETPLYPPFDKGD